jgi:hypothetical protein
MMVLSQSRQGVLPETGTPSDPGPDCTASGNHSTIRVLRVASRGNHVGSDADLRLPGHCYTTQPALQVGRRAVGCLRNHVKLRLSRGCLRDATDAIGAGTEVRGITQERRRLLCCCMGNPSALPKPNQSGSICLNY